MKQLFLLYSLGFVLVASACSDESRDHTASRTKVVASTEASAPLSPSEVLRQYLGARLNGEWERAFQLADASIPVEEYKAHASRQAPLAPVIGEACRFEIKEVSIIEDQAEAKAVIHMPDLSPYIQRLIMNGVKAELLGTLASYEPIIDSLKDAIASGDYTLLSQAQTFSLVLKDGHWKVRTDLPTKEPR